MLQGERCPSWDGAGTRRGGEALACLGQGVWCRPGGPSQFPSHPWPLPSRMREASAVDGLSPPVDMMSHIGSLFRYFINLAFPFVMLYYFFYVIGFVLLNIFKGFLCLCSRKIFVYNILHFSLLWQVSF